MSKSIRLQVLLGLSILAVICSSVFGTVKYREYNLREFARAMPTGITAEEVLDRIQEADLYVDVSRGSRLEQSRSGSTTIAHVKAELRFHPYTYGCSFVLRDGVVVDWFWHSY